MPGSVGEGIVEYVGLITTLVGPRTGALVGKVTCGD